LLLTVRLEDAFHSLQHRSELPGLVIDIGLKLHRITNADYPGADETDHTYDAVGLPRKDKTMVTGAGTTQYAYDDADRLTSVTPPGQSAVSYTFDDNGNLTDRGSDDFD
jgi:YD repeat-containing protein